ncbi:hypothetical protein [Steroidobacter sp.]|uniref:hypothetical protein n=1 Tax=Steroidobacter sp. TaxID=1978227 RepID=UPI001A39471A|nr:hypothetical protein [Steroidobacter sp.]MBL8271208.1 hypothetical protein [Steroidobacter sp.]
MERAEACCEKQRGMPMAKQGRRSAISGQQELQRLRAQLQSMRRFGVFSTTGKVLCEGLRTCRVILPFLFAWLAIRDWPEHRIEADLQAGLNANVTVESQTLTDMLGEFLGEYSLFGLLVLLAFCGVAYGRYQSKLRRDDVQRLSAYKEKYELLRDPRRSSSRLTSRGETRPEDE